MEWRAIGAGAAQCKSQRRWRKCAESRLKSGAYRIWWTNGDEDGHWFVVVSKEEFQIGFDSWGFREGELRDLILAMVPEPPMVVTAAEIVTGLSTDGKKMPVSFFTQVRTHLRNFRNEGLARSVPHGDAPQLGWQLLSATVKEAAQSECQPTKVPMRAILKLAVPASGRPELNVSDSAPRESSVSPAARLAAKPPRVVRKTRVSPPLAAGMRGKVLTLVPAAPMTITATELARQIEKECGLGWGQAQNAVETQLLQLFQARSIRTVERADRGEVGWSLRAIN